MKPLRILALEPYGALSHLAYLEGLAAASRHRVEIHSLPARAWKWRMRTAALHYAELLEEAGPFDLLFASDYVNLAELRALLPPPLASVPACVVFHENQLTYPLQPGEARDHHFALVHLYAILSSGAALFPSDYHRRTFLEALAELLGHVPDVEVGRALATVRSRACVLPLGTDVEASAPRVPEPEEPPVVLWPHRWEYDKDPDTFCEAVLALAREGVPFRLRLLGQRFRTRPPALERIEGALPDRIVGDGFLEDRAAYLAAVRSAHVIASTARHEFFGLGTLEALRLGLLPVLPDDLAYPELLPAELEPGERARLVYPRDEPGAFREALRDALVRVTRSDGEALALRRRLVAATDRCAWPTVAAAHDTLFERLARRAPPATGTGSGANAGEGRS